MRNTDLSLLPVTIIHNVYTECIMGWSCLQSVHVHSHLQTYSKIWYTDYAQTPARKV
jgi:hypothetical protein